MRTHSNAGCHSNADEIASATLRSRHNNLECIKTNFAFRSLIKLLLISMADAPGWIQLLFKRTRAGHALHTPFLLNLTNAYIAEAADSQPGGRQQLRDTALSELASDNDQTAAFALVCLGIVGQLEDLPSATKLIKHSFGLVRRAARTCCSELQQALRA